MTRRRQFAADVLAAVLVNLITWPILHVTGIVHICSWGGCS